MVRSGRPFYELPTTNYQLRTTNSLRPAGRRVEAHLREAQRMQERGELRLRVLRRHGEDAAAHGLAADRSLGEEPRAALEIHVRAAQQAGLAADDARLAVVQARDQHLRRRQAHDDRAVGVAAHVAVADVAEVDAGDDVA